MGDILFEPMQIEVQCSKNYFNFFYHKKLGLLEITEKKQQKPLQKSKRCVFYIFTEDICSACNEMQVVLFCKNTLIF